MLVDDLSATLPSGSRVDPGRDPELHKAQICLQLLELDRLSLDAEGSEPPPNASEQEPEKRMPSSDSPPAIKDDGHRRFQRFQLIRRLGAGGFGIVFLAEDPTLKRLVAIKLPRPEVLATESRRERFIEESRLVASLHHPHIIPIHEAGTFGPFCYQVLAYCSGGSLAEWLKIRSSPSDTWPSGERDPQQRVLTEDDAIQLMCPIVEAVQHAHEHGILHCDLKPWNILLFPRQELAVALTPEGDSQRDDSIHSLRPMISDFGLARVFGAPLPSEALPAVPSFSPLGMSYTTLAGSIPYMAPEQCLSGLGPIGERADVFGLGAILYELLSGGPPFEDALERRSAEGGPQPLHERRPGLSKAIQAVVARALEPRLEARFGSAQELLASLKLCVKSRPPAHSVASVSVSRSRWPSTLKFLLTLSVLSLGIWVGQRFLRYPTHQTSTESTVHTAIPEEGATFTPGGNVFQAPIEYDGQSPVTIELWCRPQFPKGFMLTWSGLISLSSDNGQRWAGPSIGVLLGEHELVYLYSLSPLTTGRWHHLAAVYDGQHLTLFIDGQPQEMGYSRESVAGIHEIAENPEIILKPLWPELGLTVGSNVLGSSPKHRYPYHGAIREIRLSTGVRYHETFTPPTRMTVDAETLALYRLTPHSESIADESGHQQPLHLVPQPLPVAR